MGGKREPSRRAVGDPPGRQLGGRAGGCASGVLLPLVKVCKKNVYFYDKRKHVCHHYQLTPLTACPAPCEVLYVRIFTIKHVH